MIADPTGHIALWQCMCTDAANDPGDLAPRCPGHDRPLTGPLVANQRPGGVALGHRCNAKPCTAARTAIANAKGDPL